MTRAKPWRGNRPPDADLEAMVSEELGMAGPQDYRDIRDPWSNVVTLGRGQVLKHIAFRKDDRHRWRFVPVIVPAVEEAQELYEKDQAKGKLRTYLSTLETDVDQAESTMPFVVLVEEKGAGWEFSTIMPVSKPRKLKKAKKKAGRLIATRPNPGRPAYMGTWDPREQDPAAQSLPGAAPALRSCYHGPGLAASSGKLERMKTAGISEKDARPRSGIRNPTPALDDLAAVWRPGRTTGTARTIVSHPEPVSTLRDLALLWGGIILVGITARHILEQP